MAVRAINVPVKRQFVDVSELGKLRDEYHAEMDSADLADHTAAVIAALLDNNRGEAARAFARARLAHCDMAAIQARCFDANVSGALLRQAFTLSKDITAADLSKANSAVNALQQGARENAKQERNAKASEPLKVPMFAGLIVR